MTTSTIDQFLSEIARIVSGKDGKQLQNYLIIEPPYSGLYVNMISEMRQQFPKHREEALESKCSTYLPVSRESSDEPPWSAFIKFIAQYLIFLRDVDTNNLLGTYNSLSELVQ